jgi:hypothetical protein
MYLWHGEGDVMVAQATCGSEVVEDGNESEPDSSSLLFAARDRSTDVNQAPHRAITSGAIATSRATASFHPKTHKALVLG